MCKRRIEGGAGPGGQGGCIEVIVYNLKKKVGRRCGRGVWLGVQSGGGMGGCEQRIEVIVCENAKSQDGRGWSGGGVGWG